MRTATILLSAATAVALAACGGSDVNLSGDPAPADGTTTTDDATAGDDVGHTSTDDAGEDEPGDEPADATGDEPAQLDPAEDVEESEGDGHSGTQEKHLAFTGYGFDSDEKLAEFGTDDDTVMDLLPVYLGAPTSDTGWVEPFEGGCVGVGATAVRSVSWDDTDVLFLEGTETHDGARHFAYWLTADPALSVLSFVGDQTLTELAVGSTSVSELRDFYPSDDLVIEDEPPFGPYLTAQDNWGELRGELTDTSDAGTVVSLNAGTLCGE